MALGWLTTALLLWFPLRPAQAGLGDSLFGGPASSRGPPSFTASGLSDKSDYVKLDELGQSFIAFGDFNRDRFVDGLVVNPKSMREAQVAFWDHEEYRFSLSNASGISASSDITAAAVADFNNDGDLDVLLSVAKTDDVFIYFGDRKGGFTAGPVLPNAGGQHGILVVDGDGDFSPDILVMRSDGARGFYRSVGGTGNYTWTEWSSGVDDKCLPTKPNSHAFVDLNGDCLPDLVLTTSCGIEVWLNSGGTKAFWELRASDTTAFRQIGLDAWNPDEADGQIVFADFNGDGTIDLAFHNEDEGHIRILLNLQFPRKYGLLCIPDNKWSLEERTAITGIHLTPQKLGKAMEIPRSMRVGDFNFDGWPDLLALTSSGKIELFENLGNFKDDTSVASFAKFENDKALREVDDAVAATFVDIDESGRQDILVVQSHGTRLIWNNYNRHADSLFFKGTGLSSLSYFSNDPRPFAPVPGNTFKLSFDSPDGPMQHACSQCPQTAYLPLQACSCLFGLTRISNYIEEMAMGGATLSRSWSNLMPNSMAVIWPDLSEGTKSWWMEYFTQRRGGQIQGIVSFLIGCLVGVALAIWYLSWRERKEDLMEQYQRADTFHL